MSFLSSALGLLGYKSITHMLLLLQIYFASGAMTNGEIPNEIINDKELYIFLENNIPHSSFKSATQAMIWFNNIGQLQKNQIRPGHTERNQIISNNKINKHSNFIIESAQKIGFVDEINTSQESDYCLILGGNEDASRKRIQFTEKIISNNHKACKEIVLVTGQRDLWPNDSLTNSGEKIAIQLISKIIIKNIPNSNYNETSLAIQKIINNEFQYNNITIEKKRENIIRIISQKYNIIWPTETDMLKEIISGSDILSNYNIIVIDAPKIMNKKNGTTYFIRPNTESTLKEFTKLINLDNKKVTLISSQPYAKYQLEIARKIFKPYQVKIDIAANKANIVDDNIVPKLLEAIFASVYATTEYILHDL